MINRILYVKKHGQKLPPDRIKTKNLICGYKSWWTWFTSNEITYALTHSWNPVEEICLNNIFFYWFQRFIYFFILNILDGLHIGDVHWAIFYSRTHSLWWFQICPPVHRRKTLLCAKKKGFKMGESYLFWKIMMPWQQDTTMCRKSSRIFNNSLYLIFYSCLMVHWSHLVLSSFF